MSSPFPCSCHPFHVLVPQNTFAALESEEDEKDDDLEEEEEEPMKGKGKSKQSSQPVRRHCLICIWFFPVSLTLLTFHPTCMNFGLLQCSTTGGGWGGGTH